MTNRRSGYYLELTDEDKRIAAEELGEDPKQTPVRIQSLREALLQMKHLTAPTDDDTLLLFLRQAKFSQTKALQNIDNFVKHRVTEPYNEIYFTDGAMDLTTLELVKKGICCALPSLPESGVRTLILRSGVIPSDVTVRQAYRTALGGIEILLRDPVSQVQGIQYIVDARNASAAYYAQLLSPTTVKVLASGFLNVIPCRMKGLHLYHSGTVIKTLIAIAKRFISSKLASRIFVHNTDESLHAAISPEILPKELGGLAGSYDELCAQAYDLIASSHEALFAKYACCAYDENLKGEGSIPTESFRQLNLN